MENTQKQAKTFLGIELLRFICAFVILVWHYQHFFYTGTSLAVDFQQEVQPFYHVLSLFYQKGLFAVQFFWVISGFIFFWKYNQIVHERKVSLWKFIVLRFSRLYPLHFVTLIAVALLQLLYFQQQGTYFVYASNDWKHFFLNLVMASSWGFENGYSFNGPFWSISVEEVTYISFFFFSLMLGRRWLWLVGAVIVFRLLHHHFENWPIIDCLYYFYLGGVAERIRSVVLRNIRFKSKITSWLPLIAIAVLFSYQYNVMSFDLFTVVIVTLVSMFEFKWMDKYSAAIEKLGNLTYSSYLLHFPIQLALVSITDQLRLERSLYQNPLTWLAFMILIAIASHFCFEYFEKVMMKKMRKSFL
jgi:peptidoglycan/LPS O-acetylase OafA/YrhL